MMLKKWKPRSVWEDENLKNVASSTQKVISSTNSKPKVDYAAESLKLRPIRRTLFGIIAVLATTLLALLGVATQLALTRTTTKVTTTITTTTATTTTTTSATTSTTSTATTTSTSTSSTSTTTTTEPTCSSSGHGLLLALSGSTPGSWTPYQLNYTATSTLALLIFGFQNENNRKYYLDSVSVVNQAATSTQLLTNPSFENSTSSPIGWIQWCTSTCSSSSQGYIVSGATCYNGLGNCFLDGCSGSSGIDFLAQMFPTSAGSKYQLSFQLLAGGSGTDTSNRFYVDIFSYA